MNGEDESSNSNFRPTVPAASKISHGCLLGAQDLLRLNGAYVIQGDMTLSGMKEGRCVTEWRDINNSPCILRIM